MFQFKGRNPIIILASSSQNRLKLLHQIGIEPIVMESLFEEDLPKTLPVKEFVEQTARYKAMKVAERCRKENTNFDIIIGCDTIIFMDGKIIGKPENKNDAFQTLKTLNGQTHSVFTGVSMIGSDSREELFSTETLVEFGAFSDDFLFSYVDTEEPINRAGSYCIQGKGAILVRSIHGCYNNVVGLPIYEFSRRLDRILKKN